MENGLQGQDLKLFIQGEYIKRNFEQKSHDIDWLIDNWDKGVQNLEFSSTYLKSLFISDIIQLFHKRMHGQNYSSIFLNPDVDGVNFKNIINKIIAFEKEWIDKMYTISCKYKICASELMIPLNIETLLSMPEDKRKLNFKIPNFLEYTPQEGFLGCTYDHPYVSILLDISALQYDSQKTIQYIQDNLVLFRQSAGLELAEYEKTIKKHMPRSEDSGNMYENSEFARLLGLLQWDMRLRGASYNDIKECCKQYGVYYCPKESVRGECKLCSTKDACKGAFATQLYTATKSIHIGGHAPIKSVRYKKYSYKNKKIKIPRNTDFAVDGGSIAEK